jgi:hypothetical protein
MAMRLASPASDASCSQVRVSIARRAVDKASVAGSSRPRLHDHRPAGRSMAISEGSVPQDQILAAPTYTSAQSPAAMPMIRSTLERVRLSFESSPYAY